VDTVTPSFDATYEAVPGAVRAARVAVARFAADAGASTAIVDAVLLSVSEAVTNSVVHAYRDVSVPGPVTVSAKVADAELLITVVDEGCGWGAASDERSLGLGLTLIARQAADLEIIRGDTTGSEVRIRFSLSEDSGAARDGGGRFATARSHRDEPGNLSPVA
jgi:anti-sigma regulatory factor (Ser/Thr protein kinase)